MKTTANAILAIMFLPTIFLHGQSRFSDNKQTVLRNKFRLQNSEGQIVSKGGDTVSREFFRTKWVSINTSRILKKEEYIVCVFAGKNSSAETYEHHRLSERMLKNGRSAEAGATMTFLINAKKGFVKPGDFESFQVVLK